MSMFDDIELTRKGNSEQCISNSEHVKNYTKKFSQALWTSLGPGSESKWRGTQSYLPEGKWQATANQTVQRFEADASNTERWYRTIHSANQLNIYGADASWCEKFGLKSDEKLPTTMNDNILKGVQPKDVNSLVMAPRNEKPAAGNRLREVQQNSNLHELVERRHSSIKSRLEDTAEQSYTWMMVSEIELRMQRIHMFSCGL